MNDLLNDVVNLSVRHQDDVGAALQGHPKHVDLDLIDQIGSALNLDDLPIFTIQDFPQGVQNYKYFWSKIKGVKNGDKKWMQKDEILLVKRFLLSFAQFS